MSRFARPRSVETKALGCCVPLRGETDRTSGDENIGRTVQGQLFTTEFLLRGIAELQLWRDMESAGFVAFRAELARVFMSRTSQSELNEAQTEDEIVKPILNALGFADAWLSQVNIGKTRREDVPDYLIFADAQRKADALLGSTRFSCVSTD
jgi:hypothetical protein